MRRLAAGQLQLIADDVEVFIDSISPFDAHRMPIATFTPAKRYVAALGHLLRTFVAPEAWLREAAFELRFQAVLLDAAPAVLDRVAAICEATRRVRTPRGGGIMAFRYADLDETSAPEYDPARLITIDRLALHDMLELDAAGPRLVERHHGEFETEFAAFLSDWLGAPVSVDAVCSFEPYGLGYDLAMPEYFHLRAVSEAPDNRPRRGLLGRSHDIPAPALMSLDRDAAQAFVRRHLEGRGAAVRDGVVGGHSFSIVLLAPDGTRAQALERAGDRWSLLGPWPVSQSELRELTADAARVVLPEEIE